MQPSVRPLLDALAEKAWRNTPLDLPGRFLVQVPDVLPGRDPASMHAALTALYAHARRWAPGLDVPYFVPPVRIEELGAELAGEFRIDEESYATVSVAPEHVDDENAVRIILAHEACHDILRQSRLNHTDDRELDEITTDLCMFICGFGELAMRGHRRVALRYGKGGRMHFGYLSSEQYKEAHDYVRSLRLSQKLPGTGAAAASAGADLLAAMLEEAAAPSQTPAPTQSASHRPPFQPRSLERRMPHAEAVEKAASAKKRGSERFAWIQIDETRARRQGLAPSLPVPESECERLSETEPETDLYRQWASEYLLHSEEGKSAAFRKRNAALVSSLETFVDKGPVWEKARAALEEKDYALAITRLKRIASMDPDDHGARLDLGCALALTGDFQGALKAFRAIKKTFEGDADYHVDMAHLHLALGDKDAAVKELGLALEVEPGWQSALDAMEQMGIRSVHEYLAERRAEEQAKEEEKARAEALAKAEEKARLEAAAKADAARAEALAKAARALLEADPPPPPPDGTEAPKAMVRELDTARLPELDARQKQRMVERGEKILAEQPAKPKEGAKAEEKPVVHTPAARATTLAEIAAETDERARNASPAKAEREAPKREEEARGVEEAAAMTEAGRGRRGNPALLLVAVVIVVLVLAFVGKQLLQP